MIGPFISLALVLAAAVAVALSALIKPKPDSRPLGPWGKRDA